MKFTIRQDESLNNAFARGVFVLIVGCLCFLCLLSTAKTCDSDEGESVRDDRLNGVYG
jgi:hypothetical protein